MDYPDDLYDFPSDYVGRKCYVSVRGHLRSIPKYKTYRAADGYNRLHPDFGGTFECVNAGSPMIMRDMEPVASTLEPGVMVTSRSQHRELMRKHNVIEVGNERLPSRPRDVHGPVTGRDIANAIKQLGGH